MRRTSRAASSPTDACSQSPNDVPARHSCPAQVACWEQHVSSDPRFRGATSEGAVLARFVLVSDPVRFAIVSFTLLGFLASLHSACSSNGVLASSNATCDKSGTIAIASDGCNLCTCTSGAWQCTTEPCPGLACPAPRPPTDEFPDQVTWVRDPASGRCCRYDNPGKAPENAPVYTSQVDCESLHCTPGAAVPAGDGCNQCTCATDGSKWTCSDQVCESNPTPMSSGKACGFWEGGCGAGEYCAFEPRDACGSFDASSVCTAISTDCTADKAVVCGCDGNNYDSRCLAAKAGMAIWDVGPCQGWVSSPVPCEGGSGACPADQYCPYQQGDGCGTSGTEINCAWRPQACTQDSDPVCGCDRKLYGNACLAAVAGVGVLQSGACP